MVWFAQKAKNMDTATTGIASQPVALDHFRSWFIERFTLTVWAFSLDLPPHQTYPSWNPKPYHRLSSSTPY
jgi:hypothetical protein